MKNEMKMNEMTTQFVSLNYLFDYLLHIFEHIQKCVDTAEMYLDECADLAEIEAESRVGRVTEFICEDRKRVRLTVQVIEDMVNAYKSCGFTVDPSAEETDTMIQ